MPDNPFARRLVTIPTVIGMFIGITCLAPVLLAVGVVVDGIAWLISRKPWVTTRSLAFLWIYLLGELWALLALMATAPLPPDPKLRATYALQDLWAGWNLRALQSLFSVEIDVTGADATLPGPIVVVSRHASMVDTLLPARLIARPTGMRLRYVLKKELLVDPALDIAGNRLPNAFIDRRSRESSERTAIRRLAEDLGPQDGVLIYPEGTRFSEAKLRRSQRRSSDQDDPSGAAAARFRRVLPPRPGGTLALLDATRADVVVLAHRGLEGLATVREIWRGALVGSRIDVAMWRIPRSEVPMSRSGRVEWLYHVWGQVDDWVASAKPLSGETTA